MTVETLFFATLTVTVVYAIAFIKVASDLRRQEKDIGLVESHLTETMRRNTRASLENNMIMLGMINQLIERIEKLENK